MQTETIYNNLINSNVLKKCTLCKRHMRTIENQEHLISVRKEWNAKTISDVRKNFKDEDLYELKEGRCQYCSKIN